MSCARWTGCRARCAAAPARSSARSPSSRTATTGRPDEEIAKALGITEEEFQDSLTQISRSSVAALDELWTISSSGGDTVSLIDTLQDPNADDPSLEMTRTEVREALALAIAKLPERERTVITLYYYEELTLREIGEVLGVTESRVSQLHTKAILRLKAKLQGSLERASLERNR
jgi:RNA polymerase sigma factor for flagellar operon FliA